MMLKKILLCFFICSSLKALEINKNYDAFLFTHIALYKISFTYRNIWDSSEEKPNLETIYANLPESTTEYISVLIINDIKILKAITKEIKDYLIKERMKNISISYEKEREPEGIYEKNAQGRWVKIE